MRFYLISFDNVEPAINDLTAQEVLSGDLDFTNHLRVCVVLVSHVKNQRISTMTNLKVLTDEIEELMYLAIFGWETVVRLILKVRERSKG